MELIQQSSPLSWLQKHLMPLPILLLLVVGSVSLVGCKKSPAQEILGKWTLDLTKTGAPGSMIASHGGTNASFTKDQKFDLNIGSLPVDGTYVLSGRTVTMHVTAFMGHDITKTNIGNKADLSATLSKDGSSLSIILPGSNSQKIYYKKSK